MGIHVNSQRVQMYSLDKFLDLNEYLIEPRFDI